jgi:hypothetical protein
MAVAPSENPYNARSDSAERLKFMLANPAPVMGAFLAFSKSEMICEFYDRTVVLLRLSFLKRGACVGIRQTINENPSISVGVTIAVIVIAIVVIILESRSGNSTAAAIGRQAYYSDDDGKTFFADDAAKISPYTDANGKTAVHALVFKCGSGKEFVGYLERYTAAGKIEAEKAKGHTLSGRLRNPVNLIEVKKPGSKTWVKSTAENSQEYSAVTSPTCPDGSRNDLVMVFPTQDK